MVDGNFSLFDSEQADILSTEHVHFDAVCFISRDPANTATTINNKFLRIRFDNCFWWRIACLNSNTYSQQIYLDNSSVKAPSGARFWFRSRGAYIVRVNEMTFQFADSNSLGAFNLFDETGNTSVVSFSSTGGNFESNVGPFLRAGQCRGVSIEDLYTENNSAAIFDFRCVAAGGTNKGIEVSICELNANVTNRASVTFYNIIWGPGGGRSNANASTGNLHDNSVRTEIENGVLVAAGCTLEELQSDDRVDAGYKTFAVEFVSQSELVPAPSGSYAGTQITAAVATVNPLNAVEAHTCSLPYPKKGMRVTVVSVATNSTFTLSPSRDNTSGARFRNSVANVQLIFPAFTERTFRCLADGIWV